MNDYLMYNGELYHFNPFHDRMGRFASSRGGTGVQSSRGMSGLHGYFGPKDQGTTKSKKEKKYGLAGGGDDDIHGYFGPKKPKEKTKEKPKEKTKEKPKEETKEKTGSKGGDDGKTPDSSKLVKGMFKDASDASSNAVKLRENIKRNEAAREVAAIDISSMSDAELKRQIDRMTLEKRYREVKTEDIRRGKDRIDEILEYSGAILGIASSAVAIAAAIKTLNGKNEKD